LDDFLDPVKRLPAHLAAFVHAKGQNVFPGQVNL
jgi:hypothetical protein